MRDWLGFGSLIAWGVFLGHFAGGEIVGSNCEKEIGGFGDCSDMMSLAGVPEASEYSVTV